MPAREGGGAKSVLTRRETVRMIAQIAPSNSEALATLPTDVAIVCLASPEMTAVSRNARCTALIMGVVTMRQARANVVLDILVKAAIKRNVLVIATVMESVTWSLAHAHAIKDSMAEHVLKGIALSTTATAAACVILDLGSAHVTTHTGGCLARSVFVLGMELEETAMGMEHVMAILVNASVIKGTLVSGVRRSNVEVPSVIKL